MTEVRKNLDFKLEDIRSDDEGRFLSLKCIIQDTPFLPVNIYNANYEHEQVKVLQTIKSLIYELDAEHDYKVIAGGNFNFIQDTVLDSDGGSPSLNTTSIAELAQLQDSRDLIDIWRIRNPHTRRFTFRQKTPLIQRRLDYFLITDILQENVKNVDVIPAICTDHSSVMLRFSNLEKYNRGSSYWKFNNALLSDTMYINSMKEKIDEFCRMNFFSNDPRLNWEFMKFKIKEFTRKYSSEKKRNDVAERSDLERKLKNLSHILNVNSSGETRKEYEDCKNRLESFYDNITKGLILRSKAEWYEKGERSNNYFYNLEKSNKSKTHVRSLIIDNSETHDQVTIMRKLNTYYSSLYARKSIKTEKECLDYLADINASILTNEEQHLCEGQLTPVEVFDALSNM